MTQQNNFGYVLQKGQKFYTGKPGINEVESVFTDVIYRAKIYETIQEANYIRGAMRVLGRFVEVVPVTIELGAAG